LEILFPPKCLVCGTFFAPRPSPGTSQSPSVSDIAASHLCTSCQEGISSIVSPMCSRCGIPFSSRAGEDHFCSACLTEKRHFRKARAVGVYQGTLMEAIHGLKYGGKTALSKPLGDLAKDTFCQFWNAGSIDLLLPVPLHIKRLRQRGFNQACLVNKKWAAREGILFDAFALSRSRWTEPQTSLARAERHKNVRGAFCLRHPDKVKDQRILLVDDVFTTGATVNECARVLMKAGARWVDVLTLARAV